MTILTVGEVCPRCAEPFATLAFEDPWCATCQWGLDRPPADLGRWERLVHRVAYRTSLRQFAALAGSPLDLRPLSAPRVATMAIALLLLGGVIALAVAGVWLVIVGAFGLVSLAGALLLLIAVALRPRLSRLRDIDEDRRLLGRAEQPALFDLVDRVAAEVGTPAPDLILVDPGMNAFTTTVGLRRQRVLCLGLGLWAVCGPSERVALLGHELGHFTNGDVRSLPLVAVANTTLAKIASLVGPDHLADGPLEAIGQLVSRLLAAIFVRTQLALLIISSRDSQRAEYLADQLGARAAGTAGAIGLQEITLLEEPIITVVRREALAGRGADSWRAAADVARVNQAPRLELIGQLSVREDVSMWSTHPPTGLRLQMLRNQPWRDPAVVLTPADSARMDRELATHYERARRELQHS